MNTDVRDQALGRVLDEGVWHLEPEADRRLPEVRRRGTVRRSVRLVAGAAAVAVFAGALGWAALELRANREVSPLDVSQWETFGGEENGWSLRYPGGWHVLPFGGDRCEGLSGLRGGILVSNVEFDFRHPDGTTEGCQVRWVLAGLPSDAVVVEAEPWVAQGFPVRGLRDTRLPLSLDRLKPTGGIRGGPAESFRSVVVGGEPVFIVRAYIGREASGEDVRVAERIVASIRLAEAAEPEWLAYEDPETGWSVEYPKDWHLQALSDQSHTTRMVAVFVSNVPHDFSPPPVPGLSFNWNVGGLPPDAVSVELLFGEGGVLPSPSDVPDTEFPLSLDHARWVKGARVISIYIDGFNNHVVMVRTGPEATREDREIAERIVSSIRVEPPTG